MRWTTCWLVVLCAVAFGSDATAHPAKAAPKTGSKSVPKSIALPVTTSSPAARQEF